VFVSVEAEYVEDCSTCHDHHLAAVSVIEAMLALAGENMGGKVGNVLVKSC
jgi:hypothetical protein